MKDIKILQQIAKTLLSPDNQEAEAEILVSYQQPAEYINQFKQELWSRTIDSEIPELPLIALVNALERRNKLVEMDWEESFTSFINGLCSILPNSESGLTVKEALIDLTVDDEDEPDDFLPEISALLDEYDLLLLMLDIDSDSYPLIILRKDEFSKLDNPDEHVFLKKI